MKRVMLVLLVFLIYFSSAYAESIGGVRLGMSPDIIFSMYGEPNKIFNKDAYYYYTGNNVNDVHIYNNGLAVTYEAGKAIRIAMIRTNNYDRKFDNTGLGLNNSYEEYCNRYNLYRKIGAYVARQYENMGSKQMATFKTDYNEYMWINFVNGTIMGIELNNYPY